MISGESTAPGSRQYSHRPSARSRTDSRRPAIMPGQLAGQETNAFPSSGQLKGALTLVLWQGMLGQ